MNYVYISYSRHDREFSDRLSGDLSDAGFSLWRDIEQIQPGQDWKKALEGGLREAGALLYLSSSHSVESKWMDYELQAILQRGIKILPLVLDDAGAGRLPTAIQHIQWVDFRTDYEQAFRSLVAALSGLRHEGEPERKPTPKSKGYVFLSYAKEDASFVEGIRSFLKERGYAYWDYEESERNYHGQFSQELESVIRDAAGTLCVLSPAWKRSTWTDREYFFSLEVGTPVFLLKAVDPGPTLSIAGQPYIDFMFDRSQGFEKLERELRRKGL